MKTRLSITICLALAISAAAAEEKAEPAPAAHGPIALYDTVEPVDLGETAASIVAEGTWKQVAADAGPIQGDAVLVNDKIAAVVHKGGGVDVYAKGAEGWSRRARLAAVAGKDVAKLEGIKTAPGVDGAIAVEANVIGAGDAAIVFSMKPGQPVLKAAPKGKVGALRTTAPSRIGVLPDFFADDLMIDARMISVERTEIPSENMFLHMTGDGSAIVAAIWEKNVKDIEVTLSGKGDERLIDSTDVFFGSEGGSIYIAVLEQKGIWYARDFTREEGLKGVKLEEWAVPFAAKWKGNFMREDKISESMQLSPKRKTIFVDPKQRRVIEMGQENPNWARDYATAYVGLQGAGVIYPISRAEKTPLEQLCLDDVLRMSLGTGPCESILDLAARQPQSKGIFTCSYRGMFGRLFPDVPCYEKEIAKRFKDERYFLRRQTRNVLTFITNVQDRINRYVEFGVQLMAFLDEYEKKHPDQAEFIKRLRGEWARPVWQYDKKPYGNSEKSINAEIALKQLQPLYKAVRIDTPEQLRKGCGAGGVAGSVGDPGDRRLRNMRRKIMVMRAMATMEMAMNPSASDIAKEVRRGTEAALRNPHSYERVTVW